MNVLDTSVILKWFLKEEDSDKAIYLRSEYLNRISDIAVPDLLLYEVSNALRYKADYLSNDIKLVIESIFKSKIKIVYPTLQIINRAIELSNFCDVSIYDSIFLSTASDLNCYMITADEKFYKKIFSRDNKIKIKLLKNIIIN